MIKKLAFTLIFCLLASLLLITSAFAQQASQEGDVDLVRFRIVNNSGQSAYIILSTIGLPVEGEATLTFTTDIFDGPVSPEIRRLLQAVGTESGEDRYYGLSIPADDTRTFTVERGVYFHRTFSCSDKVDGVVDVRSQLRLVFITCEGDLPNFGEPTMEKVDLAEEPSRIFWRYRFQDK
jgi:hypothetical protein